jgi:hypothetical protein
MADRADVHFDKLITWRDGELASEIGIDEFPRLMVKMAMALQYREKRPANDVNVPLG